MPNASSFARLIDATPIVDNATVRAALFPNPAVGQRVANRTSGYIERWDGANWAQETPTGFAGPVIFTTARGGKSDGSTDDTAAVSASVAAAQAQPGGGVVVIPPNTVWTPALVAFPASVVAVDYSQLTAASEHIKGVRFYGNGNLLLGLLAHANRAGALRREAGTPAQGGRVLVHDQLWVEDDLWVDEGIQVTSFETITSTTLAAQANAGAATISLAATPAGFVADKTIHLKNGSGQVDRPRILSIVGNVATLDAPLQFTHTIGEAVKLNIWRGSIFPVNSWDVPGGVLKMGATQVASEAATNPQTVALSADHVAYDNLIHRLIGDAVFSGGDVTPSSGMVLNVNGGVAVKQTYAVTFTSQTVTIAAADATNPRKDIVVVNLNGVASVVAGTPAGSPVAPAPTAAQTLLATIDVAALASSIGAGQITDSRQKYVFVKALDAINGGYRFGTAEATDYLVIQAGSGATRIAAVRGGAFASIGLSPFGGGIEIGGGTPVTKVFHGQATLVGGTKVVNTAPATNVTANSRIFLGVHTPGGAPGWLQVSARVPGTSFTILSSSGTDTSVVDYMIVEP